MRALIFGAGGQDGFYLTELLLCLGYEVSAILRRSSVDNTQRLEKFINNPKFKIFRGDVTDYTSVYSAIEKLKPDEVYNLAGQSSVGLSFQQPIYTFNSISNGCLNILEAIRSFDPSIKFYQASSGEMFGAGFSVRKDRSGSIQKFQDESTVMLPQSPYAVAKLAAHNLVVMYRNVYNLFACSGILYNHESPHRGEEFVTRKITKWVAEFNSWIKSNEAACTHKCKFINGSDSIYIDDRPEVKFPKLRLGNIHIKRDWGHSKDYVKAMHLMMQYRMADDYVISTNKLNSVQDFLAEAFSYIGIMNPLDYVIIDPSLYRPSDLESLSGDSSKANFILKWKPEYTFQSLVKEMVEEDINNVNQKERSRTESPSLIAR